MDVNLALSAGQVTAFETALYLYIAALDQTRPADDTIVAVTIIPAGDGKHYNIHFDRAQDGLDFQQGLGGLLEGELN